MKFWDVSQNSDEWFELRLGKCTGSNFATFMANENKNIWGEPAKRYALQIALERITGRKSDVSFTNSHTERGSLQESDARILYETTYFVDVKNGGLFDWGDYSDSPDGLVGNDGVIEIKSVIAPVHYATIKRGAFDPAYTWQLIGHLDCTGRSWVDYISYCSEFPEHNQLFVYRLYREQYQDHINRLKNRRQEFLNLIDQIYMDLKQ